MNKPDKFPLLDSAAQAADARPTPHEKRTLIVNGTADYLEKVEGVDPKQSQSKAAEYVDQAIADGKVSIDTSQARELGYWVIPQQLEIECHALQDDSGLEIIQEGQHGPDEAQTIHVATENAVRLARCILYAAGFQDITIATGVGSFQDVEDGNVPSNFERRDDKPAQRNFKAQAPIEIPQDDDLDFEWTGSTVLETQLRTAVYEGKSGDLVIRQEPYNISQDDSVVTIVPQNIPAFIESIKATADKIKAARQ